MIIGTAGHIDHGKTSLVKAITGVDADRLKDEKARGITIDLGFAYWPQPDQTVIGFVDVPGHERFVHTMMAGAQGVDAILLVIAADDGVMPQTREHLEIISLLGPRAGLVALTKIDRVDAARAAKVSAEIAAFLSGTVLEGAEILPVSSVTGEGIEALKSRLVDLHQAHRPSRLDRLFRLAVDRSFTLQGAGLVVTGTVLDGTIAVGDDVVVSPLGASARIRAIHAQNRPAERAQAGDRCALNLAGPGLAKEAIQRGAMILAPPAHAPTRRVDAEIRVAPGARRGLTQWMPVRLHHATADLPAHLVLLTDDTPKPGGTVPVQIVSEKPFAAYRMDRFILRDPSASFTLAGGRLLDLRAPERKRRSAERVRVLQALSQPEWSDVLAALLAHADGSLELESFARDNGEPLEIIVAEAERNRALILRVEGRHHAMGAERIERLASDLESCLSVFHAANPDLMGMGLERLRLQTAPRIPAPVFRFLLRKFAGEEKIAIEGHWIRLASHSVAMSLEDENLLFEIRPLLSGLERFRPPRVRDIANKLSEEETTIRSLMRRCGRAGVVDEVAHDHFFLRPVVTEGVHAAIALEGEQGGWFSAAAFRDRLEAESGAVVGRKVAIQFLEFLDRHGVTIRRGDQRRVNPHRRTLFDPPGDSPLPDAGESASDAASGREASLVGRPDFKSGWGREPVPGGFDSHSLPPSSPGDPPRASRPA